MSNLGELYEAVNDDEEFDEGDEATIFLCLMGDIDNLICLLGPQRHTASVRNRIAGALADLLVWACRLYGCFYHIPKEPDLADPSHDLALNSLELTSMVFHAAPGIATYPDKATVLFADELVEAIAATAVDNGFTFEQIVTIAEGKVRVS